jgi:DNA-binding NarL/FixJ family response regulator
MPPIGLLLAEDSEAMRQAIKAMLGAEPRIEILGEARSLPQTLEMASCLKPNIVLMDLHMPGEREFEPSEVKSQLLSSSKRILTMSLWNDDESKALAEEYGALALLGKANLASDLIRAILSAG